MAIGDNVKIIRKAKKFTQEELAKKMNISRSYLSDIENNRKNPSSKTIDSLSGKLGVSMFYLTTGKKALIDLTDDEKEESIQGVRNSLQRKNKEMEFGIKKDLEHIIDSELSFTETMYLNNALEYFKHSSDDDVSFLAALLSNLNTYKDIGKGDKVKQETLLKHIVDETNDINFFLKQRYHYKEGE